MTTPGDSTEVGSIVAYLRLNDSEWKRVLDEAEARARALGQTNPTIHVQVADHAAMTRIAALETQLQLLQHQLNQVGGQGSQSQGASGARHEVSKLVTALMAIAPAAIPLAGVAAGAMAGLIGSAGTAALAILGIKDAMQRGTQLGHQYQQAFEPIVDEFGRLKEIAAAGVFGGINRAIQSIKPGFQEVEHVTAGLAQQLGDIAGNVGAGMVSLFRALAPLFDALGSSLQRASAHFADWANSSHAVSGFVDYVKQELPHVEEFLSSLMQAASHVVQAFAPWGGIMLDALTGLSRVLSALPVGVVQAMGAAFLTWRLANMVGLIDLLGATLIPMLTAKLTALGVSVTAVKASLGGLGLALIAAATIYAVFTGRSAAAARQQNEAAAAIQSYTQALIDSRGALDPQVRSLAAQNLASQKAFEIANKLGIAQGTLVTSVVGSDSAYKSLTTRLQAAATAGDKLVKSHTKTKEAFSFNPLHLGFHSKSYVEGLTKAQKAQVETGKKAKALLEILKGQRKGFDGDAEAAKNIVKALKNAGTSVDDVAKRTGLAAGQAKDYAAVLGYVADKSGGYSASLAAVSDAVNNVAVAYRFASETGNDYLNAVKTFASSGATAADRAALIGATLKAASGDALNFASQMNGAAVANHQMVESIKSAAEQVGKGGESTRAYLDSIVNLKKGTIDYKNQAAQPLISGLQQIQTASINAAKAAYQHYLTTMDAKSAADQAYKVYVGQTRGSLIDEFKHLGLTAGEAKRLADNYLGVPKKVKTLIEQEGAGSVKSILEQIKEVLVKIAGAWGIHVHAKVSGLEQINQLRGSIKYLKNFSNAEIYAAFPHAMGGIVNAHAAGGLVNRPTWVTPVDIAGEAGREAIVPLQRPLSQINPSVRGLAAVAQGKAPVDNRPTVVQNFYPAQPMDANAVGAASARWYAAAVR